MKNTKSENIGGHLNRGGKKIHLEKLEDRFTFMPSSKDQLKKVIDTVGREKVTQVSKNVYKVYTSATEEEMTKIREAGENVIAHHAYKPKDSEGTMYYITDKIIVSFKPGTTNDEIETLLAKYHLQKLKQYDSLEDTFLVQATFESGENPVKLANRLAKEKIVQSAEPNLVNRVVPAFIPSDKLFDKQWHLKSKDADQLVKAADVHATEAWDITRGDRKIVIAILDDGFDLKHPDFNVDGKIVFPKDYIDGDTTPFPAGGDFHGTPCAGVAIAECDDKGVVGIAHGCAFMPVRIPRDFEDVQIVKILEETSLHADVISCSWGLRPVFSPLSSIVSKTLSKIAKTGGPRKKGCVLCLAAGNYNAPINDPHNVEFSWLQAETGKIKKTKGPILNGYASHPDVITVSASTSLNKKSAYSNWGKEISVCAPSDNYHPLHPADRDPAAPGLGIWTTDNEGDEVGDLTFDRRFTGKFGGTSSAAPLVAGVAGLILSINPDLTAAEVRKIIEDTADKIVDSDPDIVLGERKGTYKNGHSEWFGHGKVNAEAAVKKAKDLLR